MYVTLEFTTVAVKQQFLLKSSIYMYKFTDKNVNPQLELWRK